MQRSGPGNSRGVGGKGGAAAPGRARPSIRLPHLSKGGRAEFFDQPAIDQLFAIVTSLTAELSVAIDRLDTLERVLTGAHLIKPGAMESFRADPGATRERAQRRDELLQRVFAVLEAYAPSPSPRRLPRKS